MLRQEGIYKFALSVVFRGEIGTEDDYVEIDSRTAHVLFDCSEGYVGVWTCISTDKMLLEDVKETDWVFRAYHDSCWRSDGMKWVFDTYISMRDELAEVLNQFMPDYKPSIHELNGHIKCGPALNWYHKVDFANIPTKDQGNIIKEFRILK